MARGRSTGRFLAVAGAALVALLLGAAPLARTRRSPERQASGAPAEVLKARLAGLLSGMRSASWVQTAWERKGEKEQLVRVRCQWRSDGVLRLDVEEGKGAGASLLWQGDRVLIHPPGIFNAMTLHRRVDDDQLRSLRGKTLASVGFLPELSRVLAQWPQVALSFAGSEAVLDYQNAERLPAKLSLSLESLAPLSLEVYENGNLVEFTLFRDVRFGAPVDLEDFEP